MAAKAYNGKWWGAGKVFDTKREADLADPTYYAGKYYLNGQAYNTLDAYNAAAAAQSADIPVPDYSSHDSGGFFGGFLGDVAGAFGDVAKTGVDLASDALKPAEKVGKWATENPLEAAALAAGAYYGLPALAGEGAGAGALTGYDAAMADLAASAPAFTGAEAAAGAGTLSGYDAAMADLAQSTPAFTGAEAATTALPEHIPDDATFPPDYVPPTAEPSVLDRLTQLAADNPLTTAGIANLAAPTVLGALGVGQQQPEAAAIAAPKPITYKINPYELQRTYHDSNNSLGNQYVQGQNTGERNWLTDVLTPKESFVKTEGKAAGGKISSHEGLMNLHHTAQHLASQGRQGDSMLVHMNPREVADLQQLAEQKGTSLTINPHTGLPEALSLGDLNPVRIVQGKGDIGEALGPVAPLIAGAALGPAGFGLMSAGMAGLTVGGITALASGNLQKGLMAGLGAYGGAALSGGLLDMGQSAIGTEAYNAANVAGATPEALQSAVADKIANTGTWDTLKAGASAAMQDPKAALAALGSGSAWKGAGVLGAAATPVLAGNMVQTATPAPTQSQGLIRPYEFNRKVITPTDMVQPKFQPGQSTRERNWFEDSYTALPTYKAPGPEYKAAGGEIIDDNEPVVRMAFGGIADSIANVVKAVEPVVAAASPSPKYKDLPSYNYNPETQSFTRDYGVGPAPVKAKEGDFGSGGGMFGGFFSSGLRSLINDINYGVAKKNYEQKLGEAIDKDPNFIARKKMGQYAFDPQTQSFSQIDPDALKASMIATATQAPTDTAGAAGTQAPFDIGFGFAGGGLPSLGGYAAGGVSALGAYSDGGRMLRGPGDGMSDNIPAVIGNKQPARLADGEFVVPADVVSHLGNGSTEAGAKQLYKMMDRIRQQRTGKKKQAPEVNPRKAMPA